MYGGCFSVFEGTGDEALNHSKFVRRTGETLNQSGEWRAVGGGARV